MELRVRRVDIEQGQNEVVLNESDAAALSIDLGDRVSVGSAGKSITCVVDHAAAFVPPGQAILFLESANRLGVQDGAVITVAPAARPASVDAIRKKIFGRNLNAVEIQSIVTDLMDERLSTAELAAFIISVQVHGMAPAETVALTESIYQSGSHLEWPGKTAVSNHSIGGVAGDRVTMVLTPILASLGLTVPKTATRAISSASGTADAMEVLAPVSLGYERIKQVVDETNGCIVWGGAVNLAVADDKLIRIRNPLQLDPEGLVLASVMAKKKAEGVQYVIMDVPFGQGAKIVELDKARQIAQNFKTISKHLGINMDCVITDGSQPVMNAIGPALEARTVLEVLSGQSHGILLEKTCVLASHLLRHVMGVSVDDGYKLAMAEVVSGRALTKFRDIIGAQGGNADVKPGDILIGSVTHDVLAKEGGVISHVDNHAIGALARALGAPSNKQAGLQLHVHKRQTVKAGEPLMTFYTTDAAYLKRALAKNKEVNVFEFERLIIEEL